jgi:hypothetical protein
MSRSRSLFSLFAASIVVLVALYFVLTRNQAAGLYPADADSISIPLFEGFLTIGLVFVASCVGLLVPSRGALRVFRVLLFAIAALLLADSAWFWSIPNHYELAAAYFGLLILCTLVFFKRHVAKSL